MQNIYKLQGHTQDYAWGGKDYLPQLLAINNPANQPFAEYWLGAHNALPSEIIKHNQAIKLTDFLQQNPQYLGEKSQQKFGQELPFLLKILDVALPLSIQLHPTKSEAEQGYDLENQKGIALNAKTRTYKDRNHKPEMMIALSDFWLLHGFKNKKEIIQSLQTKPSLQTLAKELEQESLYDFYAKIMQADQTQLATWLMPIIEEQKATYQANQLSIDNPDYWVLYTIDAMQIDLNKLDAGLMCFYIFNLVHLKEGEGIFQDAGIPHAYLRGQNIELMACSDNVIRGGLTPKYVDIPELLKIIDCSEITPKIIPVATFNSQHQYQTPAQDFALTHIGFNQNELKQSKNFHSNSAAILLVMQGEMEIQSNTDTLHLKQGEACFIKADSLCEIKALQQGYVVVASLPYQ